MKRYAAFLALLRTISAQTSAGQLVSIVSSNSYNGQTIQGSHIGAALSQMVATGSSTEGDSFSYNSSVSQLQDNTIVTGFSLPCYVVPNAQQYSTTAGPLQCGAGDQPGYYDSVTIPNNVVTVAGISAWYVCSVNSATYGVIANTIVGSYASGSPNGPGISGCTPISYLKFGSGSSLTSSMSTATTGTPSNATSTPVPYSNGTVITVTTRVCPVCPLTTAVSTCYVGCAAAAASATAAPVPAGPLTVSPAGATPVPGSNVTTYPTPSPYKGDAARGAGISFALALAALAARML